MKYFDGELLSGYDNQITQQERDFIKTLIIKLDLSIDTWKDKVNGAGLALLCSFTDNVRKADVLKALDILNGDKK